MLPTSRPKLDFNDLQDDEATELMVISAITALKDRPWKIDSKPNVNLLSEASFVPLKKSKTEDFTISLPSETVTHSPIFETKKSDSSDSKTRVQVLDSKIVDGHPEFLIQLNDKPPAWLRSFELLPYQKEMNAFQRLHNRREFWNVQQITNKKVENGKTFYFVVWEERSKEPAWVPAEDLALSKSSIDYFEFYHSRLTTNISVAIATETTS
jgi:hypothetical protein